MTMPESAAPTELETLSETRCFEGVQGVYRHASPACAAHMTFALYLPPQARAAAPAPLLWWLSGLTCTHENAMTKAGAQRAAAEAGVAVLFPDTSPRNGGGVETVPDDEAYDLGQGAGFYVDATEAPWAAHFQMRRYLLEDLTAALAQFPVDLSRQGISGHSMGGHGALTLALSDPERWRSLSAFAPIANPADSEWGVKQLSAYLGPDQTRWAEHDASLLLRAKGWSRDILVDQGAADPFLDKLKPDALEAAAASAGAALTLNRRDGYDHSYFFVASFIPDHVSWHAARLSA